MNREDGYKNSLDKLNESLAHERKAKTAALLRFYYLSLHG